MYIYMVAKFTLRWGFYRVAAGCCKRKTKGLEGGKGGDRDVREVVNPGKDGKLDAVASRHGIDKEEFRKIARRLRWVWPLLP